MAAIRAGEAGFGEICERRGVATLHRAVNDMMDHGERITWDCLADLPKGVYQADDCIDDDRLSDDPIPIRVKVTIDENGFPVDFTGSAPQVPVQINGTWARLQSSTRVVFKAITRADYPFHS